jgi:ATP-dependent exoDNAse (exonuclease V) beta subunit
MNIHFIGAGAGSGKTYRLTKLLYEKLASRAVHPSGVIATTFTKKAASELRERVREALLEKKRFDLANSIGQARIGTVHSVCGNLLTRFAFELGLSPDLRVVEEAQALALVNQAIDAAIDESALIELTQLERRLGIQDWQAQRDWRSELKGIVDQARSNNIDAAQLAAFGKENADTLLGHMEPATTEDLDAALIAAIDAAVMPMEEALAKKEQKNTRAYVAAARQMQQKLRDDEAAWGEWHSLAKAKSAAAFVEQVECVAEVAKRCDRHPRLRSDLRRYLELIFTQAGKTLALYAARKAELGVLDFTDQECFMLEALGQPEVAATLRDELDILLVDEFQDTSPIQLALFLKLAELARETYWVGDIKQAIYGFRGSDTALMKAIVRKVPELGGDTDNLQESWRSRPALVHLVNAAFVPAFAGMLSPREVKLKPEREETLNTTAFAHWSLNGKKESDRADALSVGVRQLVESGYQLVDKTTKQPRPISYGDIAILSRANSGVQRIATALKGQGIPAAIAQPGLLRQPEAILALACLRRLNDPSDTIASAEILSLADSEYPESWLPDRLQLTARFPTSGQDRERALNAWREDTHPILKALAGVRLEQSPILSPREALQLAIVSCNLTTIVLRWQSDVTIARERLANLEALFDMASQYEENSRNEGQPATVSGLLLWLQAQQQAGQDGLAEPAIDAVQVMTHHKAKGLEWGVVILTDLEDDVRDRVWSIGAESRSAELDAADPLQNRFVRYWPWPFGKQKKDVPLAERIEKSQIGQRFSAAAIEEEKRLLYVSMTRARDLLVFAWPNGTTTGEWFGCLEAPWLTVGENVNTLALPDGRTVPCSRWDLVAPETPVLSAATRPPLRWFVLPKTQIDHLPLVFNPSSSAETACTVAETTVIGSRVPIVGTAAMDILGTALHACIAAAVTDRKVLQTIADVDGILHRLGASSWLDAESIHRQIAAFLVWIDTRWPECEILAEIPVESVFTNGQVMQGRIDLLLKTSGGWVLIDHKSNPGAADQWDKLAREHGGQLAAYSQAVTQATGLPVLENWLFFPIAAGAARISQ